VEPWRSVSAAGRPRVYGYEEIILAHETARVPDDRCRTTFQAPWLADVLWGSARHFKRQCQVLCKLVGGDRFDSCSCIAWRPASLFPSQILQMILRHLLGSGLLAPSLRVRRLTVSRPAGKPCSLWRPR